MTDSIPVLDRTGLRRFGLATGSILAVLFGLGVPWLTGRGYPVWPWAAGATLCLWAVAAPGSLKGVYRGWMRFGLLLNRVTSPLILALVFFLVIAPAGLLMRLMRRDALGKRIDARRATYRVPARRRERTHMEKPY